MTQKIKIFLPLLLVISFLPFKTLAVDTKPPILQIDIPTVNLSDLTICDKENKILCIPWIAEYIVGIYKYGVGATGILAAIVLMWGGVVWLTAGGNQQRVTEAQGWIKGSITGLVLIMTSYLILYQVNPDLTTFKSIKLKEVEELTIEEEYLYEADLPILNATSVKEFTHVKFNSQAAGDLTRLDPKLIELLHVIDRANFDVVVSCAITGHSLTTALGKRSRHADGLAVDIKSQTGSNTLLTLSNYLYDNQKDKIGELIYSYNKDRSISNGVKYTLTNSTLINLHRDHIHLATFRKTK